MVKASCPKCEDGTPKTMAELQAYWDLLESDRTLVLLLYENPAGSPPQGFSHTVIDALSKLDGAICVVTNQSMGNIPLQQFDSDQPQLVENIVGWIRAIALETRLSVVTATLLLEKLNSKQQSHLALSLKDMLPSFFIKFGTLSQLTITHPSTECN